jgi:hypothetical protein
MLNEITEDGGVIIGIVNSFYLEFAERGQYKNLIEIRNKVWGEGWELKPIAVIFFKDGRIPLTFEQFKEQNPYIKEEYLEEQYNSYPKQHFISMPYELVNFKNTGEENE